LSGSIKPEPVAKTVTDEDLWDQLEAAEEAPTKVVELKVKLEEIKMEQQQQKKEDAEKNAAEQALDARAARAAKAEAEAMKRQQEMQAAAFQDDIDPLDAFMAQEVAGQAEKDKAAADAKWQDEMQRRARGETVEEKVIAQILKSSSTIALTPLVLVMNFRCLLRAEGPSPANISTRRRCIALSAKRMDTRRRIAPSHAAITALRSVTRKRIVRFTMAC
jgi:hypothetical protein